MVPSPAAVRPAILPTAAAGAAFAKVDAAVAAAGRAEVNAAAGV